VSGVDVIKMLGEMDVVNVVVQYMRWSTVFTATWNEDVFLCYLPSQSPSLFALSQSHMEMIDVSH
jgi:hypothetical protein